MNRKILFFILILVVAFIGIFFFGGWYNGWKKLTDETLVKSNWEVEGNGGYNHITFSSEQVFKVFVYPNEVDSGKWSFDGKKLELDFIKQPENRTYAGFEFGRDGALYSLTDENRERWVSVKK